VNENKKIAPSDATLEANTVETAKNYINNSLPNNQKAVKTSFHTPLGDLDDIQFRMKCAIDLVDTVHEAMINGSFTAENYTDALFGARTYLYTLNDEMRLSIDDMLSK
jgi:hypothetical protein